MQLLKVVLIVAALGVYGTSYAVSEPMLSPDEVKKSVKIDSFKIYKHTDDNSFSAHGNCGIFSIDVDGIEPTFREPGFAIYKGIKLGNPKTSYTFTLGATEDREKGIYELGDWFAKMVCAGGKSDKKLILESYTDMGTSNEPSPLSYVINASTGQLITDKCDKNCIAKYSTSSSALTAIPDNEFLNAKVYAITPENGLHVGGYVTLEEFVEVGLKKGVWRKGDSNQWIYKVTTNDKVKRQKDDASFSFVKINGDENGENKVIMERVVVNGIEYNSYGIYDFFLQVYANLPTYKKIESQADDMRRQEETSSKNAKYQKLVNSIWGKYVDNDNFLKLSKLSNGKMSFEIETRSFDYDTQKMNVIQCRINKEIDYSFVEEDEGTRFKAIYYEDDCDIRITALPSMGHNDIYDKATIEIRGTCNKYDMQRRNKECTFNNIYMKESPKVEKKSEWR